MIIDKIDYINIYLYKKASLNPIMFEDSIKGMKKFLRLKSMLQEESPKLRDLGLNIKGIESYKDDNTDKIVLPVLPNKFASIEKKADIRNKLIKSIVYLSNHRPELAGTGLGMSLGAGLGNIIGGKIGREKVVNNNPDLVNYLNKIKSLSSSEEEDILDMLDTDDTKSIYKHIGTLGGAVLGLGGVALLKKLLRK
jgi:hypothetical protein